mmetsp:Transcript_92368/g.206430  ORF Transcript_92368/g.206430 Transcript_92368/m.206430 type:complete len:540 (-) Transcript_92368:51-1670(-)
MHSLGRVLLAWCVLEADAARLFADDCAEAFRPVVRRLAVKQFFEAGSSWTYARLLQSLAYARQWQAAKKVRIITPRSPLVAIDSYSIPWGEILHPDAYKFERNRLLKIGRISERVGHLVNESKVKSICDLSPLTLKALAVSPPFLKALAVESSATASCANASLYDLVAHTRVALESECFQGCVDDIRRHLNFTCDAELGPIAFELLFRASDACTELPFDSVETLVQHRMESECLVFSPPSPLWQIDDKLAGTPAMEPGPDAVCVTPEKNAFRRFTEKVRGLPKDYSMQQGMCPEGTRCKCLNQKLLKRPTAAAIRNRGIVFFHRGIASAISLASQITQGSLSTVFQTMVLNGITITAAITSTIACPMFLVSGAANLGFKGVHSIAQFRCQATLGCMPSSVIHVEGRGCRLKPNAKVGGSPLWFLPPPGTKLDRHSAGSLCRFDRCTRREWKSERVGFSRKVPQLDIADAMLAVAPGTGPGMVFAPQPDARPVLYNCQSLSFEVMTAPQRRTFVTKLRENGVAEEYEEDLVKALQWVEPI